MVEKLIPVKPITSSSHPTIQQQLSVGMESKQFTHKDRDDADNGRLALLKDLTHSFAQEWF